MDCNVSMDLNVSIDLNISMDSTADMGIIEASSRDTDDDMPTHSAADLYPNFTCVQDLLPDGNIGLWIADCLTTNIDRILAIFEHEDLTLGKRLSIKKRENIIKHLEEQDFVENSKEDYKDAESACNELIEVTWEIIKRLTGLVEGRVSGQAGDIDAMLTQWDRHLLSKVSPEESSSAACAPQKEAPRKSKGKGRKRKLQNIPLAVSQDERHLLDQGVPGVARVALSAGSAHDLNDDKDEDAHIPKAMKTDLAKRRDKRHLQQLQDYTGSLKKAAEYLQKETFLQYPQINRFMEEMERGFVEDIYDTYASAIVKTIAVMTPSENEQQIQILKLVEKIRTFEVEQFPDHAQIQ